MSAESVTIMNIIASTYNSIAASGFEISNDKDNTLDYKQIFPIGWKTSAPTIHYEAIYESTEDRIYVEIQLEYIHLASQTNEKGVRARATMDRIIAACREAFPNGIIGQYPAQMRPRPGQNGRFGRGYGYSFDGQVPTRQIAEALRDFIRLTYPIINAVPGVRV